MEQTLRKRPRTEVLTGGIQQRGRPALILLMFKGILLIVAPLGLGGVSPREMSELLVALFLIALLLSLGTREGGRFRGVVGGLDLLVHLRGRWWEVLGPMLRWVIGAGRKTRERVVPVGVEGEVAF